ncbi:regulator of g protein signaling [Anaeramoeba flamelloides]|uniref:Regulator of g protein signaling n=1 Tax=Anaeramoeba flamelloides TaxID=1746091 RepID=A0ABQ8Z496_9EUKA|nr:regulator of g protein signaling [Anaeramoeba flamelloides]
MVTETQGFLIFSLIAIFFELILYYFFMKRRNVSPINVRSKTLTSLFTFASMAFLLVLGYYDSSRYKYACQLALVTTFFHQTFTIWIYVVQAWRINFIYLLNKEKLYSIKRFIKKVNIETTTSKERKTSKYNEEKENGIVNSTVESQFWEGMIDEEDNGEIDKKFEKVERKFYRKRTQISGKYMFYAILIHFIFMLLMIAVVQLADTITKEENGSCDYGFLYLPSISVLSLGQTLLYAYYLFKIWKIKDNFKIRNQLIMIFITCILTTVVMSSKKRIGKLLMWQWPFAFIIVAQYLIILGYPLWLSRTPYTLTKEREKNKKDNEETIQQFTHILNNKNKSKYFFKFLQLDYSIENLLFYQAVSSFEKISPNKKKKKKKYCEQIIKTFVHFNARLEVNLEHSTRTSTIELAEKDPTNPSCFEEAKNKIFFLMYSGSYPNFINSKQYYEMMIEIDQIHIEIGGERDLQLNPLDDDQENENESQNINEINNESENQQETENEDDNKTDDENSDDHDRNQNQSNSDLESSEKKNRQDNEIDDQNQEDENKSLKEIQKDESENQQDTENEIDNSDDENSDDHDRNQNQSNSDSESSEKKKTSSETSDSDSHSD